MADETKGGGPLNEGTLGRGGLNGGYQIPQRPPDPPPMKPATGTTNPPPELPTKD